jgi:sodium-coupled neutral amino acid transporter 7/8
MAEGESRQNQPESIGQEANSDQTGGALSEHSSGESATSRRSKFSETDYEFRGTNNVPGSISLFINTALGSGILNFPRAYMRAGLVSALLLQIIFGCIAGPPQIILAYCSDIVKKNTYHEVILFCGRAWSILACVVVALYCFGACVTFQVIIGDQSDNLYLALLGEDFSNHWYADRKFTIFWTAVLCIAPFIFPRKMQFIKYVSFIGTSSVLYIVIIIFAMFFLARPSPPPPIPIMPDRIADVVMLIPTLCFGYQCHLSGIPIYACLKERNIRTHTKVIIFVMFFVTAVYVVAGIFGLLTFGHATPHDISMGYDARRVEVLLLNFAILLAQIATYPMLCFCGREAIGLMCLEIMGIQKDTTVGRPELIRRVAISSVWLIVSTLLAMFVPNITTVISVIGGLAGLIIFFFPGLCLYEVSDWKFKDKRPPSGGKEWLMVTTSLCYMTFGVILFFWTTIQSLMEIATGEKIVKFAEQAAAASKDL